MGYIEKSGKVLDAYVYYISLSRIYKLFLGRLAQSVRASALHAECRGFESLIVHHIQIY